MKLLNSINLIRLGRIELINLVESTNWIGTESVLNSLLNSLLNCWAPWLTEEFNVLTINIKAINKKLDMGY